jgi:hypothetical protein
MNDADFEEISVIRFLCEYYNTDSSILFSWRNRGLSDEDLFIGLNLATRLGRSPDEIFKIRTSGRDWRSISQKYRVPYDTLSQPVKPRNKPVFNHYKKNSDKNKPNGPNQKNDKYKKDQPQSMGKSNSGQYQPGGKPKSDQNQPQGKSKKGKYESNGLPQPTEEPQPTDFPQRKGPKQK